MITEVQTQTDNLVTHIIFIVRFIPREQWNCRNLAMCPKTYDLWGGTCQVVPALVMLVVVDVGFLIFFCTFFINVCTTNYFIT